MKQLLAIMLVAMAAALLFAGCATLGGSSQTQAPPNGSPPGGQQGEVAKKTETPPAPPAGQPASSGNEVPVGSGPEENVTVPPSPPGSGSGGSGTEGTVTSPPQAKEFTIVATLWKFTPDTITVNKGDRVKITLENAEGAHGILIPDYEFDLKAGAGETKSAEFTADKAGTFGFRCNIMCGAGHREMTGTLVVQ